MFVAFGTPTSHCHSSFRTFSRRSGPPFPVPIPHSGHFLITRDSQPPFPFLIQDISPGLSTSLPQPPFRTLALWSAPLPPHSHSSFRTFPWQSTPSVRNLTPGTAVRGLGRGPGSGPGIPHSAFNGRGSPLVGHVTRTGDGLGAPHSAPAPRMRAMLPGFHSGSACATSADAVVRHQSPPRTPLPRSSSRFAGPLPAVTTPQSQLSARILDPHSRDQVT